MADRCSMDHPAGLTIHIVNNTTAVHMYAVAVHFMDPETDVPLSFSGFTWFSWQILKNTIADSWHLDRRLFTLTWYNNTGEAFRILDSHSMQAGLSYQYRAGRPAASFHVVYLDQQDAARNLPIAVDDIYTRDDGSEGEDEEGDQVNQERNANDRDEVGTGNPEENDNDQDRDANDRDEVGTGNPEENGNDQDRDENDRTSGSGNQATGAQPIGASSPEGPQGNPVEGTPPRRNSEDPSPDASETEEDEEERVEDRPRERESVGPFDSPEPETGGLHAYDREVAEQSWRDLQRQSVFDHLDIGKWNEFCDWVLHDRTKVDRHIEINLRGLTKPVKIWQLYGAFIILKDMRYCGIKFLSDQMGLGKTVEIVCVIVLNRLRALSEAEVIKCRTRKGPEHLAEHAPGEAGPHRCPSKNPLGIMCWCTHPSEDPATTKFESRSLHDRMSPSWGANLILVPGNTVPHWMQNFVDWIDFNDKSVAFKLRLGFGQAGKEWINYNAFSDDDRSLVTHQRLRVATNRSTSLIVLSSPQSYRGQVVGKFFKERETINWGIIARDEHHEEKNINTATYKIIEADGSQAHLVMASGTPCDNGPGDVTQLIALRGDLLVNAKSTSTTLSVPHLVATQLDQMEMLAKDHKACVAKPRNRKTKQELLDISTKFGQRIEPIMLRRRVPQSKWIDGKQLTTIPRHYNREIQLKVDAQVAERLNKAFENSTAKLKQERDLGRRRAHGSGGAPRISQDDLDRTTRVNRMQGTFPGLATVPGLDDLKYTGDELKDDPIRRRYLRNMEAVTANSAKLEYIRDKLLGKKLLPHDKLVIASVSPVSAFIIYQWLRRIRREHVAFFGQETSMSERQEIVNNFQQKPPSAEFRGGPCKWTDDNPRILVSTTGVIGRCYTLTRSRYVVIFEPDWLPTNVVQTRARVSRIGQKRRTTAFNLVLTNLDSEKVVYDKSSYRKQFDEQFSAHDGVIVIPSDDEEEEAEAPRPTRRGGRGNTRVNIFGPFEPFEREAF